MVACKKQINVYCAEEIITLNFSHYPGKVFFNIFISVVGLCVYVSMNISVDDGVASHWLSLPVEGSTL